MYDPSTNRYPPNRCPSCGRYVSPEHTNGNGYYYIHDDDPYDSRTGEYCNELCLDKAIPLEEQS